MWTGVRRELRHLEWEASTTATRGDLLTEWSATVTSLLAVRRAISPISRRDDPFILLSTASRGAGQAGAGTPVDPAPQLKQLRRALEDVALGVAGLESAERAPHLTAALQVAYELAHRVRVRATDGQVRQWLLSGETALDGALHAPAQRTFTGASLAAWEGGLAAVQRDAMPILRRGVALGHLSILEGAQETIRNAEVAGALPEDYSRSILAGIRELGSAHLATVAALSRPRSQPSKASQAVMLQLGTSAGQLTKRPDPLEDTRGRLDALLRSGIGQAGLVAGLTANPDARAPADRLQRLALEYLANPRMLRRPIAAVPEVAPSPAPARPLVAPQTVSSQPISATLKPGTILDEESVRALCRTRDIGMAASGADPAHPPATLRGTDPAEWPRLAIAGQVAVADLVAAVTPMVYASTRGVVTNADDARGEMFVHLMRAAHAFDPTRSDSARWPSYAWETLQHLRWRGVDDAGVLRSRGMRSPRVVGLDGTDPGSFNSGPEDIVASRAGVEAIREVVDALPARLREPMIRSIAGQSDRVIGDELGLSSSTVHRRIAVARRVIGRELGSGGPDDEIRRGDHGSRRVPHQDSAKTQAVPDAANVSAWETTRSLPRRPAPTLGPASSAPALGIGW